MNRFPGTISSKLPKTGLSVFATMSGMADEYGAINLSQGFPDFECSIKLIGLVNKYMFNGHNQYAPMNGVMKLRETIAEKTERLYSASYNPETEIIITTGATQAIYTAISAFIREDDEVIVLEPAYDSYIPAIKLNGGVPVCIPLSHPDYSINWNNVRKRLSHHTKMIIINTPHNPTGTVFTKKDLLELERITKHTDIIILSDEVYEHIIFDGRQHQSVCLFPSLAERSIIVNSFGKTFHITGWKTGYCLGPEDLMKEFRKIHQFIVFCSNHPIQHALADFLKNKSNYEGLNEFYREKRDFFLRHLKSSRFKQTPASGTYFQLLDYSRISDEPEMDFAQRLIKEHKVGSVPVSSFYNNPVNNFILRFCFAKSEETLERAAEILCKV